MSKWFNSLETGMAAVGHAVHGKRICAREEVVAGLVLQVPQWLFRRLGWHW